MSSRSLTEEELLELYPQIECAHHDRLSADGVVLPRLRKGDTYTKDAIVLGALAKYLGLPVSKEDLTRIVRNWYPRTNDVQQARHLGKQKGWYIVSGTRGDRREQDLGAVVCEPGEYILVSLEKPYPGFLARRSPLEGGLEGLREKYECRCATCGSIEGEANLLNPSRVTELQEAHMDPTKDLAPGNAIPQCRECNQAYRDWFVFDARGRVRDINIKSPRWASKYREI